jgi:uncharacterized repeat protein (TIGR03803 family)
MAASSTEVFFQMKVSAFCTILLISGVAILQPEITSAIDRYKLVHVFQGTPAQYPGSALVADDAGNFYGTTFQGGDRNAGTVYELSPLFDGMWAYHVLHVFKIIDGQLPEFWGSV